MKPVFDESAALKGQAGLHAFIVGVSGYPHLVQGVQGKSERNLGLKPLSSAALTAYRVYHWLREHRAFMPIPMATCELLLAPSEAELKKEPALDGLVEIPTFENFRQAAESWRANASSHQDNIALFYFAGHGAQRSRRDHVLLLHDFGEEVGGLLSKAVDTIQLAGGMAMTPKFPQMALRQLYFIDACRVKPTVFQNYEQLPTASLWDVPTLGVDDRQAPMFYTAVPGRMSFGIKGNQTIFSQALLQCLCGGAARRSLDESGKAVWRVSLRSIADALGFHIDVINRAVKGKQKCLVDGHELGRDILLCNLEDPPAVDVSVKILPDDAVELTKVIVLDAEDRTVWDLRVPLDPHPYSDRIPGGNYQLTATIVAATPEYRDRKFFVSADPPAAEWPISVQV
jgi:hypothetical protein